MKTFYLTCILILVMLLACDKNKTTEIPKGILGKEAFAKVLMDFSLAESAANQNIKAVAVYRIDSTYAFDPLKENHVRKEQYDSTLSFYAENPELYKEVYQEALTMLSAMQTRRDSLKMHPALK